MADRTGHNRWRWSGAFNVFMVATGWWALFMLAGASSEYGRGAPAWILWLFDLVPLAVLGWAGTSFTRRVHRDRTVLAATWVAFCFAGPFLVYDAIFLRGYLGAGPDYWKEWWHLTMFSAMPWIWIPYWSRRRTAADIPDRSAGVDAGV